jgi:hypothetical protein
MKKWLTSKMLNPLPTFPFILLTPDNLISLERPEIIKICANKNENKGIKETFPHLA